MQKKTWFTALLPGAAAALFLSACGQKQDMADAMTKAGAPTIEINDETAESVNQSIVDEETLSASGLPAYVYCGESLLESGVCEFMQDQWNSSLNPGDGGVLVPAPVILETDETDPEDVKVWGNFRMFGYALSGSTLTETCQGGGRGLLHLKQSGDGYEAVSFDDGTDDAALKTLCEGKSDLYGKFDGTDSDTAGSDLRRARIQYLQDYVNSYGLNIDSYQNAAGETVMIKD